MNNDRSVVFNLQVCEHFVQIYRYIINYLQDILITYTNLLIGNLCYDHNHNNYAIMCYMKLSIYL